jgi:protein O-GlcNAc transferase
MQSIPTDAMLENAMQLHSDGKVAEAEAIYRKMLQIDPDDADVLQLLSVISMQQGNPNEALKLVTRALELNPEAADYHCTLGTVLLSMRRQEEAIAEYRRSVALQPDYLEALWRLASALRQLGRLKEAEEPAARALAIKPDLPEQFYLMGNGARGRGDIEGAMKAYAEATGLRPGYYEAHNNLGECLYNQGKLEEAVQHIRRAVACRPTMPVALFNLGNMLKDLGATADATHYLRQAVSLKPTDPNMHSALAMTMHYSESDPQVILKELKRWDERHAQQVINYILPHDNAPQRERRLRVGYVSADFRNHILGINLLPLLKNHDKSQIDVYCYSSVSHPDAWTEKFKSVGNWREIQGMKDDLAAEMIRRDGIDILVDVAGHTGGNRLTLFARKPAPVQITFGGYPGGTGLQTMDYRLTDPYLDPPSTGSTMLTAGSSGQAALTENDYVEKLVRLPDSFWCYDPETSTERNLEPNALPAKTNGFVTFGCLNNAGKITERTRELWASVLRALPNSRMILMTPFETTRKRLRESLGVDAGRIDFVNVQPRPEYFRTYHRIDIYLDTLPYNGHNTPLDAMWMGVPPITRIGQTAVGRGVWSHLSNLKLTELAAESDGQFVDIALTLAGDLPRLEQFRSTLRRRLLESPLTDIRRFARNVETAYRNVWRDWCGEQELMS